MFRYYGNAEKENSLLGNLGVFFLVEIWGLTDIAGDDTAVWTNKFLKLLKWIVCVKMNKIMGFFNVEYNPIFHDAFYI